ncbi:MAG: phosphoribosylformylglycinamidine cyclo-ligase [Phycisphaerae bacterium]
MKLENDHRPLTYKQAGVDIDAGDTMVDQIKHLCARTYGPRVLGRYGAFAGLFRLDFNEKIFARNYKEPVLIACTDGVGTKIKVAAEMKKYDTIGIDLVAMNVNDLIVQGGEPLFFLDYLAVHKLDPAITTRMVQGVSDGCVESGAALLGGETAEMPAVYAPGEFDMAGFAVGVVERKNILDGAAVAVGDSVIGIASSGIHSNGYALVRRICFDKLGLSTAMPVPELNCTLGEELLRPTRIYVKSILSLLRKYKVMHVIKAMSHITGGGLPGNLPRVLPDGLAVKIKRDAWTVPPIFQFLQKHGPVDQDEMFNVFNMGIGYVIIASPRFTRAIMTHLRLSGEQPYFLGKIKKAVNAVQWEWA